MWEGEGLEGDVGVGGYGRRCRKGCTLTATGVSSTELIMV